MLMTPAFYGFAGTSSMDRGYEGGDGALSFASLPGVGRPPGALFWARLEVPIECAPDAVWVDDQLRTALRRRCVHYAGHEIGSRYAGRPDGAMYVLCVSGIVEENSPEPPDTKTP